MLVVGAGPAGSAAAIELARSGARVMLVDRARFPRPKTCGDALSNGAVRIVAELGADLGRVPSATVLGSAAVFPDGSRVARRYEGAPGAIVARLDFDDLLRARALEAGAELVEGVAIRAVAGSASGGGSAYGDDFSWTADVIVAADGPASVAWSALGRRAPRGAALAVATTAYYEGIRFGDPAESEHYFEAELASGYGWVFPAIDGIANIGVYQRADRYRAAGKHLSELLARFVARHPERFSGARPVQRARSWPLPLAGARPFPGAPGVLACGDAARLVDPLTGEGIWHALHSGRLAARSALEALSAGGVDAAHVRRYAWRLAREVGWPSASRRLAQAAVDVLVTTGAFRSPAIQNVLGWGYRRGALEVSKSVDTQ